MLKTRTRSIPRRPQSFAYPVPRVTGLRTGGWQGTTISVPWETCPVHLNPGRGGAVVTRRAGGMDTACRSFVESCPDLLALVGQRTATNASKPLQSAANELLRSEEAVVRCTSQLSAMFAP